MSSKPLHPPAFCPVHGLFPVTAISFKPGVKDVSFYDVGATCPKCGTNSEIIPGTYNVRQTGLDILLDSSISPKALEALKRLAEQAQNGEISPERAKKEAEAISPKAGKLFDVSNWSDQAKATLYAAIIGATAVVVAARIASSPSQVVNVQPVIERVIDDGEKGLKDQLQSSTTLTPVRIPLPKRKPKPPPRKRR